MPEPTSTTLIHFRWPDQTGAPAACGTTSRFKSGNPGDVTCFACRRTPVFLQEQGVEAPTPLPQRQAPKLLREIIAEDPGLTELEAKAKAKAKANLLEHRNEHGMYTIEETIHHGDYRSVRRVEVHAITPLTVDCIIQSSAYCYGSWLHPENPAHAEVRRAKLFELVEDLKHGRTNRSVGWSTFRLI